MAIPDASPFAGTWRLLAHQSKYEHGEPPHDGTYRIEVVPDGVAFTLDWHDAKGKAEHVEFTLFWDRDEPASLELVDAQTLNTAVEKHEQVVAHATRRLSDDGLRMEIVQTGYTAEGTVFRNRAFYERA